MEAPNAIGDRLQTIAITTRIDTQVSVLVMVLASDGGLDPRDIGRVFDTLHSGKSDRLGMGVSISGSIVENHGRRM